MLDRLLSNTVIRTLKPAHLPGAQSAGSCTDTHPTTVFPRFLSKLKERSKPALLDLGLLCGANIAWLAGHGIKVFVDDTGGHLIEASMKTVKTPDGKTRPAPIEFAHIAYPPGAFDGMILWSLLDFMNRETASRFLDRLQLFMKPRCLIFAMCSYERSGESASLTRYRILNENEIAYEANANRPLRRYILENRELHDLFSRFEFIKSNLLKNQMREILVERK